MLQEQNQNKLEPTLEAYFQELVNTLPTQAQEHPRFIHMCGIPGSGKSTYTKSWLSNCAGDFSLVQFDGIMEALPGYRQTLEVKGARQAFADFELPARCIGYRLLDELVRRRQNIFFDHSAANRTHLRLLEALKLQGYRVEMHYLPCHPREAVKRISRRPARHTPEELIWERSALLEELLPLYKAMVHVIQVDPLCLPTNADTSSIDYATKF